MPIRPELRPFYRGPAWHATRRRILERAGGRFDAKGRYRGGARCEQCGKPDRRRVWVVSAKALYFAHAIPYRQLDNHFLLSQFWTLVKGDGQRWRSCTAAGKIVDLELRGEQWTLARRIRGQVGVAHLNHVPGDDRDENLKLLCNWCHLHHDQLQHKQTRCARKDAARPLLQAEAS